VGIAHFDTAGSHEFESGHLRGRWTFLGVAAGALGTALRRVELPPGGWSTPVHEHGSAEEIFYVLGGHGLAWQDGRATEIVAGDCIAHLPRRGAHTMHALESLDVVVFGPRVRTESPRFPRLGLSLLGSGAVDTVAAILDGTPLHFLREGELGPPELPTERGPRPANIINLAEVKPESRSRSPAARIRRDLGGAAGSSACRLYHIEVAPGMESAPAHCHSVEEEIVVVLAGEGTVELGDEKTAVVAGHVIARPPGTGVAHAFRAGEPGLTYLEFGTRELSDLCYYPHSRRIAFPGIRVIATLEHIEHWNGEE